jgi:hypothetical protein
MRRLLASLVITGCATTSPSATVHVGGATYLAAPGAPARDVAIGRPITVTTHWQGRCTTDTGPLFVARYEGADHQTTCDEERHVVHLRCVRGCEVRDPDGRTTPDLVFGPTVGYRDFGIVPRGADVELALELSRDGRAVALPLPRLHVVVPTAIAVECGFTYQGAPQLARCDTATVPGDRQPFVRLRPVGPAGVAALRIAGHAITADQPLPLAALLGLVAPPGGTLADVAVPPGDYPLAVEFNPPPATVRQEVVVRVR